MSAINEILPSDSDEQAAIERIFREQPDLAIMIETAQAKARELFPNPSFSLDTRQYDDWDPPLRLVIRADVPESAYRDMLRLFIHWLAHNAEYDDKRLSISFLPHALPAGTR